MSYIPKNQEEILNPNAVGFCWFTGNSCICIAIWWNPEGYTGLVDDKNEPILGCMQAQISAVPGISQEEDINQTINWGTSFDLDVAATLINRYGGWVKPAALEWRPRAETNSPLKLKLKYKDQ